jgi:O-antigen ligase
MAPAFLAVALVFGGATHGEAISSAVVRLAALGLLGVGLWTLAETGLRPGVRWPAAVLACAALLPLIQLLPLPPGLWTQLPGREPAAAGFRAAGLDLPWMPISLAPSATLDAFLSLVPPAAIFLATINLDERSRRRLSLVIVGVAILATLMGAAQVASGTGSSLRMYEVTNIDSAVGFFANRNHQAALLVVALPLTAYWLGYSEGRSQGQRVVYMMVAAGLLVIFLVSLGVTRSRAGIGLGVVAIVASAVLLWFSSAVPRIVPLILVVGLIAGGGLVAAFALEPLLQRFQDPVSNEARLTLLPGLFAAGKAFWPIGSGLGSFVPAFQLFERPETLLPQFVNHAHNDYLELWIEAGALGLIILAAGLVWFATAAVRAFLWPSGWDTDLPRVAAIIVLILVVHSAVDYPLRTAALSVVFALACGLLTPAPSGGGRSSRRRSSQPANDGVRTSAVRRLPSRPSVTTRARRP